MKKVICLFLIQSFFTVQLFSQTTFHKQIQTDLPFGVMTSVLVTDSCYYMTGVVRDWISPNPIGNIFTKYSLDGEEEFRKILAEPGKTYETWWSDLQNTPDGNFIITGGSFDTLYKAFIMKYNQEGDTIGYKEFANTSGSESTFFVCKSSIQNSQGGHTLLIQYSSLQDLNDFALLFLDSSFNQEKFLTFGGPLTENCSSLLELENGNYLIGTSQQNHHLSTNPIRKAYILEVDTLGETQWEFLTPTSQLRERVNKMLLTDDQGIIAVGGIGVEIPINSSSTAVHYHGTIFKLNANHELEWETVTEGLQVSPAVRLEELIAAPDGSGYLAAGVMIEDQSGNEPNRSAHLFKVSPDGDSLWNRFYNYIDDLNAYPQPHDLQVAPDGGYIMVGTAAPLDTVQVPQTCWMLKVDEYGCLVPDCQNIIIDNTFEEVSAGFELKMFPNPTKDFLNVFVRIQQGNEKINFRIFDSTGKEQKSFSSAHQEETLIIDIQNFSKGIYFLEGRLGSGQLLIKQFVVE